MILAVLLSLAALPPANELARRYADAVVVVDHDDDGPGPHAAQHSQGFFVSSSGLLCTVLPQARVGDAVVVVGAERWRGVVVAVDVDEGLALVSVPLDPNAPVAALGLSGDGARSRWLVGLMRDARGVSAVVGGEEEHGLLLPVPRGAPVFNANNVVVAVARRSKGGGAITVIGIDRLKVLATTWQQSTATTKKTATTVSR